MLDKKTKGISAYAFELLHYGYNVTLDLPTDTIREQGIAILPQFMEQFNNMHDATNLVITMEKLTYNFNKQLYMQGFRDATNPFENDDRDNGK